MTVSSVISAQVWDPPQVMFFACLPPKFGVRWVAPLSPPPEAWPR